MVPGGLLMSAVVASVGADGVSDSGSEVVWVGVGSGVGGSAVARTVVSLSPVLRVVRDGDAADGVGGGDWCLGRDEHSWRGDDRRGCGNLWGHYACRVIESCCYNKFRGRCRRWGGWWGCLGDYGERCGRRVCRFGGQDCTWEKKIYHGFHKNIKQHKFSTWIIIIRNVSWAAN